MAKANTQITLILQPSENCLQLTHYINNNIEKINKFGVIVAIQFLTRAELDEEMVNMLQRRGVSALPAMITYDGTIYIGNKNIVQAIETSFQTVEKTSKLGGLNKMRTPKEPTDLDSYIHKEMLDGVSFNGGNIIINDDDSKMGDEDMDVRREMSDFYKRRPDVGSKPASKSRIKFPPQRGSSNGQRGGNRQRPPPRRETLATNRLKNMRAGNISRVDYTSTEDIDTHSEFDNSELLGDNSPNHIDENIGNSSSRYKPDDADDMDSQILSAWLDNEGL